MPSALTITPEPSPFCFWGPLGGAPNGNGKPKGSCGAAARSEEMEMLTTLGVTRSATSATEVPSKGGSALANAGVPSAGPPETVALCVADAPCVADVAQATGQ